MESNEEKIRETTRMAVTRYLEMATLLRTLPIAYELPDIMAEDVDGDVMLREMSRARVAIDAEPVSEVHKAAYVQAILTWITGFELVSFAAVAGDVGWREEAARIALAETAHLMGEAESQEPRPLTDFTGSDEGVDLVAKAVFAMYDSVRETFRQLPIEIELPDPTSKDVGTPELVWAMAQARFAINDEPISETVTAAYAGVIIKWFTAYELVALDMVKGSKATRVEAAKLALAEMGSIAGIIESGDVDGDGPGD